ncbi:MAG: hypothetical protein HXX20_14160 [Chloroflexi bacterium]|nr:hypothetical protein [Chloroflexota bacterium]
MRVIQLNAKVDEQCKMLLELPPDVLQGEYQVVLVFADNPEAVATMQQVRTPKPPLKLHIFEWDNWPKDATFGRDELYDDVEF